MGRPLTGVYKYMWVGSDSWAVDLWPSGAKLDWVSNCQPCVASWAELSWVAMPIFYRHRQHARVPNQHHEQASPPAPHLACRNTKTKTKTKALSIFICILANSTLNMLVLCISHWSKVIRIRHCHLAVVFIVVSLKGYYTCRFVHIKYECSVSVCAACVGGHCQREMCSPTHTYYAFYILYIHV